MVDYFQLVNKYIPRESNLYRILTIHSVLVVNKALQIGQKLSLSSKQLLFIEEAGMLHDIGIVKIDAPDIDCHGKLPYICHGVEGAKILRREGLPEHALVAERHIGVGITATEIMKNKLPLPEVDYIPASLEEQIITYADCFYSKDPADPWKEKTIPEICISLGKYRAEDISTFKAWQKKFR